MTSVPLAQLDLTPVQRLLLDRLAERPLPFPAVVELVRAANRLDDEVTLPVRLDRVLWTLLDAGAVAFERAEVPVVRWADVIPTAQLLTRAVAGDRWTAIPAAGGLWLVTAVRREAS